MKRTGDILLDPMESNVARKFRLLPSEQVRWSGTPRPGTPRDLIWRLSAGVSFVIAAVAALFAALLRMVGVTGWEESALMACYVAMLGVGILLAPTYLLDPCEFLVTDRRVLWRRPWKIPFLRSANTAIVRSIEPRTLSYTRIRWHRSVPGVGTLELVRAVPFGPLARNQRLVLHDLDAPDRVLALIRGVEPSPHAGDDQMPLTDRLDPGEEVLWGAGPEGWLIGWREMLTAIGGAVVVLLGLRYGADAVRILMSLERGGLAVGSGAWMLLFTATLLSFAMMVSVGGTLLWYGSVRARTQGRETEYVITNKRLLIRRGRTELSLDRKRIFDVAETPTWRGLRNVFLILDGPEGRALGDSGALRTWPPSREPVGPVLYEVRDSEGARDILLERSNGEPPMRDAA